MAPLLDTPRGKKGTINRNTGQFVDPYNPAPSAPTISVTGLQETPKPFSVPVAPPPTQATGMNALFEAGATSFQSGLDKKAEEARLNKDNSLSLLLKGMGETDGEASLTDELYKDTVDPAEAELNDINNQILQEQHALRRRIEAIRANDQGVYGGALEDMVQEAERDSLTKQADLAIIQLSKQNKFDSARAIADRAVRAITEKQKQKNDLLKFIYEESKDEFTTAEKRSFETAQADRERTLQFEQDKAMKRFEQTIRQSDPLYQAQLAEARVKLREAEAEAATAAAQLITSPDQQREYLQRDINIVDNALKNNWGLEASSGLTQGGIQGAFFETPGGILLSPITGPMVASAKQDFLSEAGYIVKNLTFDKIKELGDKGIKLTPISERELKAMGDASSVLVSAARFDDQGNLTGFNISEDKVRKQLTEIKTRYQNAVQDITASQFLSDDDMAEINSL